MRKIGSARFGSRSLRLFAAAALAVAALAAGASQAMAKPPSGNTLPPVTIVVDADGFEYRPDLGGVYDTRRGVVWGYSLVGMANFTADHNYAKNIFPGIYADRIEIEGDIALADGELAAAEAFYDAAAVAASFTNWRTPTLAEARDAVSRGLFTYGAAGLNMWTGSPADIVFGLPYNGFPTWTSDGGRIKSSAAGWVFQPNDGSAHLRTVTSNGDAIMVRSYTGP